MIPRLGSLLSSALAACLITLSGITTAQVNLDAVPDYYQDPGISPNRNYVNQKSGELIDPFTGKLQFHVVDLFLPGNGGLDIKVQRSYTSTDQFLREPLPVGIGWTMSFGRIVSPVATNLCLFTAGTFARASLELPDGSRLQLYAADSTLFSNTDLTTKTGLFVTKNLWKTECAPSLKGLVAIAPDGTRYTMDVEGPTIVAGEGSSQTSQKSWYVSSIQDRNGNTLTFTYKLFTGYQAVDTITASDGRTFTFTYDSGGILTSVTDGTRMVRYASHPIPNFIGAGYVFLDTVTRPDGTTWRYTYNETFAGTSPDPGYRSMASVTYPTGGVVNYTYAAQAFYPTQTPLSNVISRKTEINGGAWTFAYAPSSVSMASGVSYTCGVNKSAEIDMTTISGPEGVQYHCHVGHESAFGLPLGSGFGFAIGHRLDSIVGSETDGVAFAPLSITNAQTLVYPGGQVAEYIAAPIIQQRVVNRDGQGYSTLFQSFDQYGNPATVDEDGGQIDSTGTLGASTRSTALTYSVDPFKWILRPRATESISVNGVNVGTISRSFDDKKNVLSETRFGVTTAWSYTANGDVASMTDARQNTTLYGPYQNGIALNEKRPIQAAPTPATDYQTITRTVDAVGNVRAQTDGTGVQTLYEYDGLSRLTKITHPIGNPVTVTWGSNSRVVTRGGFTETTSFDGFGRRSQVQAADAATGETITHRFTYDPVNRLIFATDANSGASSDVGTQYDYDQLGRIATTWFTCPGYGQTAGCAANRTTSYSGLVKTVFDELGVRTQYAYRGFGNPDQLELMAVNAPYAYALTGMTRNGVGQITSVTQDGVKRSYGYDASYFLTSSTEPETGTTIYGRDAVGNLISRQVGTTAATTFSYDGMNRLTSTTYPAGTPSVTHSYYLDNKIRSVDNGSTVRSYVYDANKNLTSETLAIPAASQSFTVGYAYSGNDALATLTYGSGTTIDYAPDNFNRPSKAAPFVTATGYFPNGMTRTATHGNGAVTEFTQNARLWPATMHVTTGGVDVLNSTYGYDLAGNPASVTDTADPNLNRTLSYDAMQRLSTAAGPWGSRTLQYDGKGNLSLQFDNGSGGYGYTYETATNRLIGVELINSQGQVVGPARTFTHDGYGNVTGNGLGLFTYDDAYTQTCLNCGTSTAVAYQYDGAQMRVSATPAGGTPTYFVYGHGGSLLWELTPGGALKEYVYLGGKQVAQRRVDLTATPPAATVDYLHADAAGSPLAATDATGTVIRWRENYAPFGQRQIDAAASSEERQFFHGQATDAESGMSYVGARYYDPLVGRFMGVDPKGFDEASLHSFNRYSYGNNNPYRYKDPDGRDGETIQADCVGRVWQCNPDRKSPEEWAAQQAAYDREFEAELKEGSQKAIIFLGVNLATDGLGGWLVRVLQIGNKAEAVAGAAATAEAAAAKSVGPAVGGGAKLENLTAGEIVRIQNAANRTSTEIAVVGSRAKGTAHATSDWDYVVPEGTKKKTIRSLRSSLPEGPRGLGEARNQDFFKSAVDPDKPSITFTPQ